MNNSTYKVAFSGILCGLSIVVLFFGSLFPSMEYALPAISGLCLIPLVIDVSRRYAAIAYAAVSLLSMMVVPNKEVALLYTLFFGFYPILKSVFESLKSKFLCQLFKLLVFNISMIAEYFISIYIFGLPIDGFVFNGVNIALVILFLGNFVFLLYDIVVTRMVVLYVNVIKKHISKIFKL